ncbi:hypothetical protein PoB_006256500 [Plakobranchus ocellatus]|uniref:Uncharacterized protein n=1 Tax=Plakobranchus ocellatus TaxID=259542 RepID=A0AAV4CW18_9GAST|nr:hypothetical protein PoB_006256500 [Plakobranchus ocellatus]
MNAYINSIWRKDWDAEGANKLHEVLHNMGEDLHRRGEGAGRKRRRQCVGFGIFFRAELSSLSFNCPTFTFTITNPHAHAH